MTSATNVGPARNSVPESIIGNARAQKGTIAILEVRLNDSICWSTQSEAFLRKTTGHR